MRLAGSACLMLVLALSACAKDPRLAVEQALAGGDLVAAHARLNEALESKPERADLHALGYVLARHLSLNGPEAGKGDALNRSIAEYEWLAAHFGLPKDYTNSDASLRAHEPALALLESAGKSLYR